MKKPIKKGSPGFNQLFYKGKPVIPKDYLPCDTIAFINEDTAKVRLLNWKTSKKSKLMGYREFFRWVAKQYEKTN